MVSHLSSFKLFNFPFRCEALNTEFTPGTDQDGASVPLLHLAAADGDIELLKTLIGVGVDLNERDSKGWPALHYAIGKGHFECAALLLESGVNLSYYTDEIVKDYFKTIRQVQMQKQIVKDVTS